MQEKEFQIQIPETSASVLYSDQVMLTHSPVGLVLDFGQFTPQMKMTRIVARIGMSPLHAKLLMKALGDQINAYEKQFGEILVTKAAIDEVEKGKTIGFQGS